MRIETKTYFVYKYEELSKRAKENVRNWYLEHLDSSDFTENCNYLLYELFPNSYLKVEFSLNYCQGDGLNIYGEIDLGDVLKHIANNFTEEEQKFIKWACETYPSIYEMPSNFNKPYCYCTCSRNNFTENWLDWMDKDCIRDIPEDTLNKFNKLIGEYLDNLCAKLEEDGYNYFYEVSDEELLETCEANGWEFDVDGNMW